MMAHATFVATLGWLATAIFTGSYFFRRTAILRGMQMLGATVWVLYGLAIGAPPVVAANLLVLGAAAWTSRRDRQVRAFTDR